MHCTIQPDKAGQITLVGVLVVSATFLAAVPIMNDAMPGIAALILPMLLLPIAVPTLYLVLSRVEVEIDVERREYRSVRILFGRPLFGRVVRLDDCSAVDIQYGKGGRRWVVLRRGLLSKLPCSNVLFTESEARRTADSVAELTGLPVRN